MLVDPKLVVKAGYNMALASSLAIKEFRKLNLNSKNRNNFKFNSCLSKIRK